MSNPERIQKYLGVIEGSDRYGEFTGWSSPTPTSDRFVFRDKTFLTEAELAVEAVDIMEAQQAIARLEYSEMRKERDEAMADAADMDRFAGMAAKEIEVLRTSLGRLRAELQGRDDR